MLNFLSGLLLIVSVILLVVCILFFIAEQKSKIVEKYAEALFEQGGKAIFLMDFSDKKVKLSNSFETVFGRKISAEFQLCENFAGAIYSEDKNIFQDAFDEALEGKDVSDVQFRLKNGDEPPVWCSLTTITIKNRHGKKIRIIGSFGNIDKRVRLEESLKNKAEHDLLTGLYNKQTTEILVRNTMIDRTYSTTSNAFMIIDIDNLKKINDTFGHALGDKVIQRLGETMKMIFRESDILGRIGGDEFIAFLKNCGRKNNMLNKARQVCQLYKTAIGAKNKILPVTCSIGVVFYPEDGKTFDELYKKADKALYSVKCNTKNFAALYASDMSK